jgi:type IV pilus assembly protein PilW
MGIPAMIRVRRSFATRRRMAGLSLIEMMIALVMALIVAAGIITVFTSTSSSNQVQTQMATLQEAGRYAIYSLRNDLSNANGGYCSNTGGNASQSGSGVYLDNLRSPTFYVENQATINAAFSDNTTPLPAPTEAFALPSYMYMRGYDCGATSASCTPTDPSTVAGITIPEIGTTVGDRVPGTSVLTIRFLKPGSGWAIVPTGTTGSTITASDSTVTAITLGQRTGEDPTSDFKNGDLAMLADCSSAQVFQASFDGTTIKPDTSAGANYAQPIDMTQGTAPRVFDFNKDFETITYYVKVVDAGNGHTTGELERRVDGTDQPVVRGVERLDFDYGIINSNGDTEFLDAADVDKGIDSNGTVTCPPDVPSDVVGGMPTSGSGTSCLWRAVQTIEVHVLMDGQTPLASLTPEEEEYIYTPDGGTTPTAPSTHGVTPSSQGFSDDMLRREFTSLVTLRNYNP